MRNDVGEEKAVREERISEKRCCVWGIKYGKTMGKRHGEDK